MQEAFPPVSLEARILILCTRRELDSLGGDILRDLISRRPDVDLLSTGMVANFITHLVRRHVRQYALDAADPLLVSSLDAHSRLFSLRQMRILQLVAELEGGVLRGKRHALMKGPTLSLQCYADALTRQYRDIDILLSAQDLPEKTGVYFFYDHEGNVIYVGKANNIRKRVVSHFRNKSASKTLHMRSLLADIDYELTGNELMALLIESAEIKKHQPRFNRSQRRMEYKFGVYDELTKDGYIELVIDNIRENTRPLAWF